MSAKWLFLTQTNQEPIFRGETKLKKIGIPLDRIMYLEELVYGTFVHLDDGSGIEVTDSIEEIMEKILFSGD